MFLKRNYYCYLISIGLCFVYASELDEEVLSKTSDYEVVSLVGLGDVQGFREESSHGNVFYSFLGIPYAKPPTGSRRFKDPEPVDSWEGVRDGTIAPQHCSQIDITKFILRPKTSYAGEEDCLYLNVYTPEPNLNLADLPVLVYIHGGHFVSGGASDYEPYDILNTPVVLVVVQYRLGILGFLSTEDLTMPGNLGLKDQTLALKWISKNIDQFGGSPLKVTLFGSGSGAASVHYQILSHHSIGLFTKAILQSGSALCPWAQGGVHKEAAYHIGKHFKCFPEEDETSEKELTEEETPLNTNGVEKGDEATRKSNAKESEEDKLSESREKQPNEKIEEELNDLRTNENEQILGKENHSNEHKKDLDEGNESDGKEGTEDQIKNEQLLQCLQNIDVENLTMSTELFYMWSYLPVVIGPYIDKRFIPESPEFLLKMGRHKRLDLIIGINKDDGSLLTNSIFISEGRRMALKHHFPLVGPISLEFSDDDAAPLNMSIKAYDKYSGGLQVDTTDAQNLTRLYTDRHFGICSDLTADLHATNNERYKKSVYLYELHHRGQRSSGDAFGLIFGQEWISQGDELYYLFPFNKTKDIVRDEEDSKMKETMISMWYYFAETGNPTPNGSFEFTWEKYTKDARNHLKISTSPVMEEDNRVEEREFWTSLPTHQNMYLYEENFANLNRPEPEIESIVKDTESIPSEDNQGEEEMKTESTTTENDVDRIEETVEKDEL